MNLKKFGKVFTSKSVGTGPSSYEKNIYRTAVSQRLRNTALNNSKILVMNRQCTLCDANTEFLSVPSEVLFLEGARDIFPSLKNPNRFWNPRNILFSVFQSLFARRTTGGLK